MRMEENYRRLKEINKKLRREIRQRMGGDLNELNIKELQALEAKMNSSLLAIRERKEVQPSDEQNTLHLRQCVKDTVDKLRSDARQESKTKLNMEDSKVPCKDMENSNTKLDRGKEKVRD